MGIWKNASISKKSHHFEKQPYRSLSPFGILWGSCCFILRMSQKKWGTFQILSTPPEFVAHSIIFAFFLLLTDIKRHTDDTLPAAGPPATFASWGWNTGFATLHAIFAQDRGAGGFHASVFIIPWIGQTPAPVIYIYIYNLKADKRLMDGCLPSVSTLRTNMVHQRRTDTTEDWVPENHWL